MITPGCLKTLVVLAKTLRPMTTREIMDITGATQNQMTTYMQTLVGQGKVDRIYTHRTGIVGQSGTNVYKLSPKYEALVKSQGLLDTPAEQPMLEAPRV